jgi:hypothetical protein
MAAVLQVVRTAQGRRPGQQRLGLAERGVLAAHAREQERNGRGPGRSVMQGNREEATTARQGTGLRVLLTLYRVFDTLA